jgi:hypothetical protein
MTKIIEAKKFGNIEIAQRQVGSIWIIKLDSELLGSKEHKVYLTRRTSVHIMKKLYAGCIGMSVAIIDKIRNIHGTHKVVIKYDRQDGGTDYYLEDLCMWDNSTRKRADGLDVQKFHPFMELSMNKLELAEGVYL